MEPFGAGDDQTLAQPLGHPVRILGDEVLAEQLDIGQQARGVLEWGGREL